MSYTDLFHYSTEAEIRAWTHIKKPSAIGDIKSVEWYNTRAERAIAEAEQMIKTLKEYQLALCDRYQEIYATNYKMLLLLKRHVRYDNYKNYTITLSKKFDGNNVSDEIVLQENFGGKERHKALKRFDELRKEYPSIEYEIDIAKKQWEK